MNIVFLVSGNGGNLKFFYHVLEKIKLLEMKLHVVADRECGAIDFARDRGIPEKVIHYTKSDNLDLQKCLRDFNPDIVVTNWHKIIDEDTVRQYRGKLINLHYSLLPSFGGYIGTIPIEMAYEKGCRFIGATCHHVDEEVDNGLIISQAVVEASIPLEQAVKEVFRKGCLILLNSVLLVSNKKFVGTDVHADDFLSPPLRFDISILDQDFWKDVSSS